MADRIEHPDEERDVSELKRIAFLIDQLGFRAHDAEVAIGEDADAIVAAEDGHAIFLRSIALDLTTLRQQLTAIDEALLAVCPDNASWCVGTPEDGVGRYLVLNENGDPLVDTSDAVEAIRDIGASWTRLGEQYERQSQQLTEAQADREEYRLAAHANKEALTEAEAYIGRLRAPLLWYFGTTDPGLLTETWADQAHDRDADRLASHAQSVQHPVRPHTPGMMSPRRDPIEEACDEAKRAARASSSESGT